MTESAPVPIPAGWYQDPANPAGHRWWSGAGWTDHTIVPDTHVAPAPAAVEITQPEETPYVPFASAPGYQPFGAQVGKPAWSTPWIWVISALPLASLVLSFIGGFIDGATGNYVPLPVMTFIASVVIWVTYILLAVGDSRSLRRQGHLHPTNPAWMIIPLIYVILRTVRVRQESGAGLTPMFVFLAGGALVIALNAFTIANGLTAPSATSTNARELLSIEQGIQTTLAQDNDIHVTVSCPPESPTTPLNVTFTCTATDAAGNTAPIKAHFDAPHHFLFTPPVGLPTGG
jgi:Protein of unknown function (DUF2510)